MKLATKTGPSDAEVWDLAERIAKDIKENHMSPPGALGLPKILDERRLKYGIPDEAFQAEAAFDRMYVWQIMPKYQETKNYGGTLILMPETAQKREKQESCRGIVVSAGLSARDSLKSNGMLVGDIIEFVRFGIFHKQVGSYAGGHSQEILMMRDGDIIGSEDVVERLKTGEVVFKEYEKEPGVFETRAVFNGREYKAKAPLMDESY